MDKPTITIHEHQTEDPTDLYWREPGQPTPQPVSLMLDLEYGDFRIEVKPPGSGLSMRAYHGVVRAYRFDYVPTVESANHRMREVAPLAQELVNLATVEYDRNGNPDPQFADDDQREAIEQKINDALSECDWVQVLERYDLLTDKPEETLALYGVTITPHTQDDELARIADQLEEEFAQEGVIVEDSLQALTYYRDELREAREERLEACRDQVDALEREQAELIREIYSYDNGEYRSYRDLAELSGMDRNKIGRIIKGQDTTEG